MLQTERHALDGSRIDLSTFKSYDGSDPAHVWMISLISY
jgi:hypothetical protein